MQLLTDVSCLRRVNINCRFFQTADLSRPFHRAIALAFARRKSSIRGSHQLSAKSRTKGFADRPLVQTECGLFPDVPHIPVHGSRCLFQKRPVGSIKTVCPVADSSWINPRSTSACAPQQRELPYGHYGRSKTHVVTDPAIALAIQKSCQLLTDACMLRDQALCESATTQAKRITDLAAIVDDPVDHASVTAFSTLIVLAYSPRIGNASGSWLSKKRRQKPDRQQRHFQVRKFGLCQKHSFNGGPF